MITSQLIRLSNLEIREIVSLIMRGQEIFGERCIITKSTIKRVLKFYSRKYPHKIADVCTFAEAMCILYNIEILEVEIGKGDRKIRLLDLKPIECARKAEEWSDLDLLKQSLINLNIEQRLVKLPKTIITIQAVIFASKFEYRNVKYLVIGEFHNLDKKKYCPLDCSYLRERKKMINCYFPSEIFYKMTEHGNFVDIFIENPPKSAKYVKRYPKDDTMAGIRWDFDDFFSKNLSRYHESDIRQDIFGNSIIQQFREQKYTKNLETLLDIIFYSETYKQDMKNFFEQQTTPVGFYSKERAEKSVSYVKAQFDALKIQGDEKLAQIIIDFFTEHWKNDLESLKSRETPNHFNVVFDTYTVARMLRNFDEKQDINVFYGGARHARVISDFFERIGAKVERYDRKSGEYCVDIDLHDFF